MSRCVEHPRNHRNTAVLDLGGLGVLFVIDEVLGECLSHELLHFIFLNIALPD